MKNASLFQIGPSFIQEGEVVASQDFDAEKVKQALQRLKSVLKSGTSFIDYADPLEEERTISVSDEVLALALNVADTNLKIYFKSNLGEEDPSSFLLENVQFLDLQGTRWALGTARFKVAGKSVLPQAVVAVRSYQVLDLTVDTFLDHQLAWLIENVIADFDEYVPEIVEDRDDGD